MFDVATLLEDRDELLIENTKLKEFIRRWQKIFNAYKDYEDLFAAFAEESRDLL